MPVAGEWTCSFCGLVQVNSAKVWWWSKCNPSAVIDKYGLWDVTWRGDWDSRRGIMTRGSLTVIGVCAVTDPLPSYR